MQCELCGATDIVKDGDFFICQSCGMKYTPESAKKMMVEGIVQVEGTVKVDESDSIANFIQLAQHELDSSCGEKAIEYADKALELDPENAEGWMIKSLSIKYVATFGDLKLKEMLEAGKKAINYAPESEKESYEIVIYDHYLDRASELMGLVQEKILDLDFVKSTFDLNCRINFLTASDETAKSDASLMNLYNSVRMQAQAIVTHVPDEAIAKSRVLIIGLQSCGDLYEFVIQALDKRYSVYGYSLNDEKRKEYMAEAAEMKKRSKIACEKYNETYLKVNPKAKQYYDDLEKSIKNLSDAIQAKNDEIEEINATKKNAGIFQLKEKSSLEKKATGIKYDIEGLKRDIKKLENKKEEFLLIGLPEDL